MNLSLLITDDERMDREGLSRQIDWGAYSICDVLIAKDGSSALYILREQKIDILFTDIKMPIMSGLELAQKARELHNDIEIVIISGYDDFSYAQKAININVHGYLLKPVMTQELESCVDSLVSKIKTQRGFGIVNIVNITNKSSNPVVQQVMDYISKNYMNDITLEKIAQIMYYTPNHLGNMFIRETNMKFSKYIMEYRIKQAALLLYDPNIKINEASIAVGYRHIPTFIKNFKSVFGVTPSVYRRLIGGSYEVY